jgi:hypothetical protein
VLGRDPVGQPGSVGQIGGHDDGPVVAPRGSGDGAAGEGLQSRVDGLGHRLPEGGVGGDEDGLGAGVVLGLAEQVERDPVGVVVGVGDHEDFGGACDHVDADLAEHAPLGGGDIGVAGAGDLVHRGDAFGAVGQCRNRLRPADPVDFVDPGQAGRRAGRAG